MNTESKFEIANKAERLYFSIIDITTCRQHYPVRFRRIADKLQECSISIYCNIIDANSYTTELYEQKRKKWDCQTQAINECNKLLSLIKYSLHANLISAATSEKWTSAVCDVKYMTLHWREKR